MLTADRRSGVLLHPTSLPGGHGIGDLGAQARRFVDWLAGAGQAYWQVLPLVAVNQGGSPYNGLSAMAGNAWLLDLTALVGEGLLDDAALQGAPGGDRVDFAAVGAWKDERLRAASDAFRAGAAPRLREELERYRRAHGAWLGDYALFRALRDRYAGAAWTEWDPALRDRAAPALAAARDELRDEVGRYELEQLLFDRQWSALRAFAAERGVRIIGDIPIFVAHDSADVWAHRDLFRLDRGGRPTVVSGVPPDYFSESGQRWGNPLYDWDRMRSRGFLWWTERFRRTLEWVDLVRVDHFRGFEAYWEIPAGEETAVNGEWRPGPGRALFDALAGALGEVPVVAEDLGLITPEVEALRDELGLPGMRVLQFAFDGDPENPHLPENHPPLCVSYTGTHDNDTVLGWWRSASRAVRTQVLERVRDAGPEMHWTFVSMALGSRARLAVVPLQDVLGLGREARMNTPGTADGNWSWRALAIDDAAGERLRALTGESGRLPTGNDAMSDQQEAGGNTSMKDAVVLVTGGAGNVGRSVTRAFLEAGARVAVPFYKTDASNALDALRAQYRDRVFSFALDLTTERGAQEAVREVVEWGGRLDSVVHLVGGYSGGAKLTETAVEAWDRMMDLNLKSAWLVARFAIPVMLPRRAGSLVFVSSRDALRGRAGHAAYAISKAALLTLVEAIAEEFGDQGIRATAILPTTVDTEANRRSMPDVDPAEWTAPEVIARTILGLASGAQDVGNGSAVPV